MTNARQFLDEIAGIIRAAGREVTIEESSESFGTFAYLSTTSSRFGHAIITLSARYSSDTKRWALGEMNVWPATLGKQVVKSRRSMRIAARTWANC